MFIKVFCRGFSSLGRLFYQFRGRDAQTFSRVRVSGLSVRV